MSRRPTPSAPLTSAPESCDRLRGRRVLLADDAPLSLQVFSSILSGAGALVSAVKDGGAALHAAASAAERGEAFDVAILDYDMPVLDGVSATRTLRSQGFRGPIVGLTAGVGVGTSIQWRSCGCDAILPKALAPKAVVARIAALTSHSRIAKRSS